VAITHDALGRNRTQKGKEVEPTGQRPATALELSAKESLLLETGWYRPHVLGSGDKSSDFFFSKKRSEQ
jgi:hypothetical protein